jgi:hypothetical protein
MVFRSLDPSPTKRTSYLAICLLLMLPRSIETLRCAPNISDLVKFPLNYPGRNPVNPSNYLFPVRQIYLIGRPPVVFSE